LPLCRAQFFPGDYAMLPVDMLDRQHLSAIGW